MGTRRILPAVCLLLMVAGCGEPPPPEGGALPVGGSTSPPEPQPEPQPEQSCAAESDAKLCASVGRQCGRLVEYDDCEELRTVASCGACAGGQSCTAFGRCVTPSECGNGTIDPGESCDGNCPTSVPPSTTCHTYTLHGDASTCDAWIEEFIDQSCDECPLNAASMSGLGVIGTGSFFDRGDHFVGGACGMDGSDAVLAWTAPSTGLFTFKVSDSGTYLDRYAGQTMTTSNRAEIEILDGSACVAGLSSLGCDQVGSTHEVRLALSAGKTVLVIASRSIRENWVDCCKDLTATYSVSVSQCTPDCSGKQCGDDGCGGSCGSCATGTSCSAAGQCLCAPECSGRSCGPDGCGGSCGSCGWGSTCSGSGQCVCTPQCGGRSCGSDGCGGSCGSCTGGAVCTSGSCVTPACDPAANTGCVSPEGCWLLSNETAACSLTGSGGQGASCTTTSNCRGGYGCFVNQCRKICRLSTGLECSGSEVCNGVTGWSIFGACAQP